MNVPVISSDVGGQKELINSDVGIIVDCNQKEEEIDTYQYSDEEVNQYVDAIEKIASDLEKYSKKCRKRILNGFTINQMIENMNRILEEVYNSPNKEKIKNGEALNKCLDITKELITKEYILLQPKYKLLIEMYSKGMGTYQYSHFQDLKNFMWKYPFYRSAVSKVKKTIIYKKLKKK